VRGFRDHVQQATPSDAAIVSSVDRLLADSATDFLLASAQEGSALGYIQLRYQYCLGVSGSLAQIEDLFVVSIWLNTNERNVDAMRLYTRGGYSSARERWQGGRQLRLEPQLQVRA
jgi:hypothetical protein